MSERPTVRRPSGRRLGVAVIGAGAMGQAHLAGWATVPDAVPVVVADPDLARAAKLGRDFGIDSTADWHAAIDRPDVDVVSVCVPTCFHAEVSVFAAEHGKHILCEKPIALDLDGADRMIRAAEAGGVHLTIGLMYRTSPATARVREAIQAGRLGRPLYCSLHSTAGVRPKPLMHAADGNGGPFVDFLVHTLDWWSVLLGSRVEWVCAQGCTYATRRSHGLEAIEHLAIDTGSALLRFQSGDMADVLLSWGLPFGAKWITTAEITGPRGRLIGTPTGPIEFWDGDAQAPTEILDKPSRSLVEEELHVFAGAVRSGQAPFAPAREAREVLKVSLAILESMKTRRPVDIRYPSP